MLDWSDLMSDGVGCGGTNIVTPISQYNIKKTSKHVSL